MKDKVILLCGGLAMRWSQYLDVEKHFVEINAIKLIENTLNILRKYDLEILIITREDTISLFSNYNYDCISIPLYQSKLEYYKIKSTIPFWSKTGNTIILMGDVWYSQKSIKKILLKKSSKILFFGRQGRNLLTNCKHGELFAIKFSSNINEKMSKSAIQLEDYFQSKQIEIAGGWGLYNIVSKTEFLMNSGVIIKGKVLASNFINIYDITDDIDSPNSYLGIIASTSRNRISYIYLYLISFLLYKFYLLKNVLFEIKLKCKDEPA